MVKFIRDNKFKIYFIVLLAFLVIEPLPTPAFVDTCLVWLLITGLFFIPYFMCDTRRSLIVSIVIFSFMLVYRLFLANHSTAVVKNIGSVAILAIFFGLILFMLQRVVRQEVVSEDLIYSGLTGFFLIAIGFALVYQTLQDFGLATFSFDGQTINLIKDDDLIYYSLSSISTLGIGDIVPLTPIARRLTAVESSLGALYIAVFIGRLVGVTWGTGTKTTETLTD